MVVFSEFSAAGNILGPVLGGVGGLATDGVQDAGAEGGTEER